VTIANLLEPIDHVIVGVFALLFGMIWGSFLNVVIHRLPNDMSVVHPPSHCPQCETPIKAHRNIPVLSWVLMGGKASCCGARISARYPLVEAAGGILSLAVLEAIVLQLPGSTPYYHALAVYVADLALVLGLLAAAFIDLEHMFVPDSISLGGAAVGLATFALRDMRLLDAAIGALVGYVVIYLPFVVLYRKLRGRPGMGMGDAKLMMLAGAWFGYSGALFVLGAAALQGTLAVIIMVLLGKPIEEPEAVRREREELLAELELLPQEERAELQRELDLDPLGDEPGEGLGQARMAFGPFLILATLECLLLGPDRIVNWVLSP